MPHSQSPTQQQAQPLLMPPRSIALTQVTEWCDGQSRAVQDSLAVEEPLEIRAAGHPLTVTMRTPGHDLELAAGFLLSEGLIEDPNDLADMRHQPYGANVINLEVASGTVDSPRRNYFSTSGCGICGKATIESLRHRGLHPLDSGFYLTPELLCQLPDRLRRDQQVFSQTGGLHAAALFDSDGRLLVLREDIGRHNAVDKIIGHAILHGLMPLSNHILMVSGRGGFEIVQKAIAARIPVLASVSAPSSLAVRTAREFGLTLVGFLRDRRFVVYSGQSRCLATAS